MEMGAQRNHHLQQEPQGLFDLLEQSCGKLKIKQRSVFVPEGWYVQTVLAFYCIQIMRGTIEQFKGNEALSKRHPLIAAKAVLPWR